jgi:hypothetical protein
MANIQQAPQKSSVGDIEVVGFADQWLKHKHKRNVAAGPEAWRKKQRKVLLTTTPTTDPNVNYKEPCLIKGVGINLENDTFPKLVASGSRSGSGSRAGSGAGSGAGVDSDGSDACDDSDWSNEDSEDRINSHGTGGCDASDGSDDSDDSHDYPRLIGHISWAGGDMGVIYGKSGCCCGFGSGSGSGTGSCSDSGSGYGSGSGSGSGSGGAQVLSTPAKSTKAWRVYYRPASASSRSSRRPQSDCLQSASNARRGLTLKKGPLTRKDFETS